MRVAITIIFIFVIIAIGVGLLATVLSKTSKKADKEKEDGTATTVATETLQISQDGGKTFFPAQVPAKKVVATTFAQDPDVSERWWLGTGGSGIFVSNDKGVTWQPVPGYQGGIIAFVRVPHSNGIYVSNIQGKRGRVLYSPDLGTTFQEVFSTATENISVSALAIDGADNRIVYAATSDRIIYRSLDNGASWQRGRVFPGYIRYLLTFPQYPNDLYAVIAGKGVLLGTDHGNTWSDQERVIPPGAKNASPGAFPGGNDTFILAASPHRLNEYLLASVGGVLRTKDKGFTFELVQTLIPPSALPVLWVAYDPTDPQKFVASAANALYFTDDNGLSWSIQRFNTTLRSAAVFYDRTNAQNMFTILIK